MIIGFTWATGASVNFMSELLPEDRKAGPVGWGRGDTRGTPVVGLGVGLGDGVFWGKMLVLEVNSSSEFFFCLGILFSFFLNRMFDFVGDYGED